MKHQTGEIK